MVLLSSFRLSFLLRLWSIERIINNRILIENYIFFSKEMSKCCFKSNPFIKAVLQSKEKINKEFMQFEPITTEFTSNNLFAKHVAASDQVVNFYPVQKKGPNYLKYCTGMLSKTEKPSSIQSCVWEYTSATDWFCSTINLALASDSSTLHDHGNYIKQLKYSIGKSPIWYQGTVMRGKISIITK
jgi:hypothetical protein